MHFVVCNICCNSVSLSICSGTDISALAPLIGTKLDLSSKQSFSPFGGNIVYCAYMGPSAAAVHVR